MSNNPTMQKPSVFTRAVGGLVLVALIAACDSPPAPSRNLTAPGQGRIEPGPDQPDLVGTYTMTLTASSSCRSELPEAVRTRSYKTTIAQVGAALMIRPQGQIYLGHPGFTVTFTDTNAVVFEMWFEEYPEDPPNTILEVFGPVTATVSAGGLSGFLDGSIVSSGYGSALPANGKCPASDHGVVFAR